MKSSRLPALTGFVAVLFTATAATAQNDTGTIMVERPKYTFLRFNEDWSVLRDRTPEPGDFWDPIKYVPLSEDGKIWASFGGSTRARVEAWSNFLFQPAEDDVFVLWRLLLHGDFHFGENVRVFLQGKTALSTPRYPPGGRTPLDVDTLALEAAFVDVKLDFDEVSLVIRPGRQPYLFGKERLVSPLPWANTLRRWDGVTGIMTWNTWKATAFWSYFVPTQKYDFNEPDTDWQFYGVYATGELPWADMGMDLYFLGYDLDKPFITANGTTGPEERYTLGGRLFGPIGGTGLDYDFEGAYQFGKVGSGDVSAYMLGGQLGYRLGAATAPRFFLGLEFGSGDKSFGGDVETFNQLFPLGHAYFGYIDAIGRQNAIDFNLGVQLTPIEKLKAQISAHFFWRDSTADGVYNAGGVQYRAGSAGASSEIGQELDFRLVYQFDRHLKGLLGYSHFFPGSFIEQSGAATGATKDIDFFYVQLEYSF